MKLKLTNILMKKLDTIINPKIENKVIWLTLVSGVSLMAIPKIFSLFSLLEIKSETFEFWLKLNNDYDSFSTVLGFILVSIACVLLYLYKFYKRPEVIIVSDSPSARLWKDSKYSFNSSNYVHPKILLDLIGWVSDTGQQINSINLEGSNESNRYFGDVEIRKFDKRIFVKWSEKLESFEYEYLGTSESGVHVLHCVDCGGGSGRFNYLTLVVIELIDRLEYNKSKPVLFKETSIRMIGCIHLGDRYDGEINFDKGVIRIPKNISPFGESDINKRYSIIIR